MRTGIANLPLHGGKCPPWLFERMTKLAAALVEVMVADAGPDRVLQRLADPFWFQAFGCALGFDWHSSGLTTTVCGALKEALKGREWDTGIFIAGGKGKTSLRTPEELRDYGERFPLATNPDKLIYASRMAAKVDNTAVQDGYQLYHHTFLFTASGLWAVIQQGMNESLRWARRYHWLSTKVSDFTCEPHLAVCCDHTAITLNLVAEESGAARQVITEVAGEKPEKTLADLKKLGEALRAARRPKLPAGTPASQASLTLSLPATHPITFRDLHPSSLNRVLLRTYSRPPKDFNQLLATEGLGPKSLRALSLLAELAYGTPPSYRDPVKYSFAHGGKDGYPYPVDRKTYDQSVEFLRQALNSAKVGRTEKIQAFRRLAKFG
ncbi:MAG: DUF763 domain-containing protein [Clostridia bacterium]|nr:DUF763 domain-containing protein [Clostridia bacterium]